MEHDDEEIVIIAGSEKKDSDPVTTLYLKRLTEMRNSTAHIFSPDEMDTLQGAIFSLRRVVDERDSARKVNARLTSQIKNMRNAVMEFAKNFPLIS